MAARWRREMLQRRREARARAMIGVANRTWRQNPSKLNALTSRVVGRVVESQQPKDDEVDDLYLDNEARRRA